MHTLYPIIVHFPIHLNRLTRSQKWIFYYWIVFSIIQNAVTLHVWPSFKLESRKICLMARWKKEVLGWTIIRIETLSFFPLLNSGLHSDSMKDFHESEKYERFSFIFKKSNKCSLKKIKQYNMRQKCSIRKICWHS